MVCLTMKFVGGMWKTLELWSKNRHLKLALLANLEEAWKTVVRVISNVGVQLKILVASLGTILMTFWQRVWISFSLS